MEILLLSSLHLSSCFSAGTEGGQATGLGLSLKYNLITKGHSGELLVDTLTDGFAESIIQLTANSKIRTAAAV